MRSFSKVLAMAAMAAAIVAAPAVQAREDMDANIFVKNFQMDKDGMVTKEEFMKKMEKMFDKQDTKKMGKIDQKQLEQFWKDFTKEGGA